MEETKTPPPPSIFAMDDNVDVVDQTSNNEVFIIEDLPEDYDPEQQQQQPSDHDQLPSVEEYKASMPISSKWKCSKKTFNFTFAVLAAVTFIIGVTAIAKSNNHKKQHEKVTYTVIEGRTQQIEEFLFTNQVSTLPELENSKSPQHKAAAFVADGDSYSAAMELTEETARRFVERYVLAVIYYHFSGNNWTYKLNFLTSRDHCEWNADFDTQSGRKIRQGVICDEDGYVVGLNLAWNNLQASHMPREIGYFGRLESLQMFNNNIGGEFPESFRYMTNMKSIGLMKTGMVGTLPSWIGESLTQLTTLGLGNNKFYGQIPESIQNLNNLKLLGLDNNDGLRGNMNLFKSMSKLEALYLQNNALTGSLLNLNWPNLLELDVSNNVLAEDLPSALFNHRTLKVLDLHGNKFYGEFPGDIVKNEQLEYLAMQNNQLKGTIPDRLGFMTTLKHLDLSSNGFTGTIPDTLAELNEMRYLATSENNFDAQPMMDLTKLKNLKGLAMKSNSLTGTIPDWIAGLFDLEMLDLESNSLTGSVPSWIGLLRGSLKHLLLNNNELTGTIPLELGDMQNLQALFLNGNSLHGDGNAVCESDNNNKPEYFVTDCYPGVHGESPEVECRCCTQCCRDNDSSCNNSSRTWESSKNSLDPVLEYGDIRRQYSYHLENAPVGYSKSSEPYQNILP